MDQFNSDQKEEEEEEERNKERKRCLVEKRVILVKKKWNEENESLYEEHLWISKFIDLRRALINF